MPQRTSNCNINKEIINAQLEVLFQLISGSDGEGGVNPSREAIVKEACDYYSLNSDFTTKQYESLKQLYPERTTFKQLTELCDNEVCLI